MDEMEMAGDGGGGRGWAEEEPRRRWVRVVSGGGWCGGWRRWSAMEEMYEDGRGGHGWAVAEDGDGVMDEMEEMEVVGTGGRRRSRGGGGHGWAAVEEPPLERIGQFLVIM
jgi:hypothetical protein